MAQHAEFEEKEFEQPLNVELLSDLKNPLWPPGQVFEEHFGIDVALRAENIDFWKLFDKTNIPRGIVLDNFTWGQIWRRIGHKRDLPTFNTNLFLQVKRSQHRLGRNMNYASHGIDGQYWLFEITKHQQKALEYLCRKVGNRAFICYASPAFHTLRDLYRNITNKTLVSNTSFVKAQNMVGHEKWVYNRPGNKGLACSKIDEIDDKGIYDMLSANDNDRNDDPLSNLEQLEGNITQAMSDFDNDNPVASEFFNRRIDFSANITEPITTQLRAFRAFFNISTFCNLTKVDWSVFN